VEDFRYYGLTSVDMLTNCLLKAKIEYVWQIFTYDFEDILKLRNAGRLRMLALKIVLERELGGNYRNIYRLLHKRLNSILEQECLKTELKNQTEFQALARFIESEGLKFSSFYWFEEAPSNFLRANSKITASANLSEAEITAIKYLYTKVREKIFSLIVNALRFG